eukprot:m.30768 g.30768  ORF g.30768 m.30768 type:complete len:579 (-) comp8236_c0_seq4:31-1767(-)
MRITELSNELSSDIDTFDSQGIVRILAQVDQQLFTGWREFPSVNELQPKIERLVARIVSKFDEGSVNVVFSGCGTSGRIAWLCARNFNRIVKELKTPALEVNFKYLVSGDDEALLISKELPEDDARLGAKQLQSAMEGSCHTIFVGITCGLSAPYVGGQIEFAIKNPDCTTVLIGFNPVELARDVAVEGWDRTCRQVFSELADLEKTCHKDKNFVLNPIVGPEAITGSSRMKGGSMTKILLETVFIRSLQKYSNIQFGTVPEILTKFETAYQAATRPVADISKLIDISAKALRSKGHLYYLGSKSFGLVALMDASEMVDTYGCRIDEVRAFVQEGWDCFDNNEGSLSEVGDLFRLSLQDFEKEIIPKLTKNDTVILVNMRVAEAAPVLKTLEATEVNLGTICVASKNMDSSKWFKGNARITRYCCAEVDLECSEFFPDVPFLAELATKFVLNSITTAANVLKGSVFGNSMINLTVSNNKLFHRSAGIVHDLSGAPLEDCSTLLLKSIYSTDVLSPELLNKPLSQHIEVATPQSNIVPVAALLGIGRTIQEAQSLLQDSSTAVSLGEVFRQARARSKAP